MSENIVRVKKDVRYFVASNIPFNDERLSWEARGIMGYLLSKPDEWQTRMSDLVNKGPAGLKVIRRVLAELRKYGYMSRKNVRGEHGHWMWITTLYESPELNTNDHIAQTAHGREAVTEAPSELHVVSTDLSTDDIYSESKKPGEPTHADPVIKAMFDCGMFPNAQTHDYLKTWREKHADERILQAVQTSAGKNQKYVDSVLVGWEANGYPKTREERIEAAKHGRTSQSDRPQRLPSGL